jgi:hypothetical protein
MILATGEAEFGRIVVQDQPGQKVHNNPSQPKPGSNGVHLSPQDVREKHKQVQDSQNIK